MINQKQFFQNHHFDKDKMICYLTIIQSTLIERDKKKFVDKLFYILCEIVQKNINNFLSLCRSSRVVSHLEESDMISESYIVFVKAAEKVDFKYKKEFHFYYNKSLSRHFYRIFEKLIREKNFVRNYEDVSIMSQKMSTNNSADFVDFYCDKMNLTKIQRKIVVYKTNPNITLEEFITRNKMTKKTYRQNIKVIEEKAKKILIQ